MRYFIWILLVMILTGCSIRATAVSADDPSQISSDTNLLEFYRQYSSTTDPGAYVYLYQDLPASLPELCRVIKSQFIHPYAELPKYREQFPKDRWGEMYRYPDVQSMLAGLVAFDSTGLTKERQLQDKLILGCWHNSVLLASILKSRGTPARLRAGHASYIMPGFHVSHTVCEVWDDSEQRWMLIDPSMDMVDFSRDKFDLSNELWLQFQNSEIDPTLYGVPRRYTGMISILGKVCPDLASVLGTEYPINHYPPILNCMFEENKKLSSGQIELLNHISELMKSLDAENLKQLQKIYNTTPEIQITQQFRQNSVQNEKVHHQ